MYTPTNTNVQGKELPMAFSFDFNSPVVFTFRCSFATDIIIIIIISSSSSSSSGSSSSSSSSSSIH
jgi:hypothetical protein